ncbi:MAG TPA: sugar ABC transporter permease [Pseudonocardiaceae bacterium]|jgi:multiple sugar transport system permease protein|nr:sugar ABC transporter permease [Pseudonocardiaceae bacterium]
MTTNLSAAVRPLSTPPLGMRGPSILPRRRRVNRSALIRLGFVLPVIGYTLVFFIYPLGKNIVLSFQDYGISSVYTGSAPFDGIANYTHLFTDPAFRTAALNTVVFVIGSLLFQFVIGLGLATFFRRTFPLNGILRSLLLIPWLLPLVVSGTVFRWMLNTSNGVINEILRSAHLIGTSIPWLDSVHTAMIGVLLCNIWIGIPFNMVILYGGLQSIPANLYEAAWLDGANRWNQFRHITLPMLRPVITVVLTLGLIYTIKVFDVIWVLTNGGPANSTQTITTYAYQLSFGGLAEFGLGAAAGNLLIVVALVFAIFYVRSSRAETAAS